MALNSYSQLGGLMGLGMQRPRAFGQGQNAESTQIPGMSQREVMGYARYLPGSRSPLDPQFSQNLLSQRGGNWQSMVPQRAQAGFQRFLQAFGNPTSFQGFQGAQGGSMPPHPMMAEQAAQAQQAQDALGALQGQWGQLMGGQQSQQQVGNASAGQGMTMMPQTGGGQPYTQQPGLLNAQGNWNTPQTGGNQIQPAPAAPTNTGAPVVNALMRNRTNPTSAY